MAIRAKEIRDLGRPNGNSVAHAPDSNGHASATFAAVVLCGGAGTRIRELTGDKIPKALFQVHGGRKLMSFTIEMLDHALIPTVVFATDHHADAVTNWVNGANLPHEVIFQEMPRSSIVSKVAEVGARLDKDHVLICNADEVRSAFSLAAAMAQHMRSGAMFTAVVTDPRNATGNSILLQADSQGKVIAGARRQDVPQEELELGKWLQHAGLMLMRKEGASHLDRTGTDWDSGINFPAIRAGAMQVYMDTNLRFFNVNSRPEVEALNKHLASEQR